MSYKLASPWPLSSPHSPTLRSWKKIMSVFLKLWNKIAGSISNCYKKHIINFQYFTFLDYPATAVSIVLLRYLRFPHILCPLLFNNWASPSLSAKNMLTFFYTIYEDVRSNIFLDSHFPIFMYIILSSLFIPKFFFLMCI